MVLASRMTLPIPDEVTGRTQFQPEIAVDQATGTVVLSSRDARGDAANARVATYITASTDGGNTFNTQVYANPSQTAIDAITGQTDILSPMADNQSGGDPQRNTPFGYGTQMGLAVFGGHLYPIWAGNLNQSFLVNGVVTGRPLNILYQPMVITAGPRIINSSMGPITYPVNAATGAVSNVDISVTFDRPVSASSFLPADVQVYYLSPTFSDPPNYVSLPIVSVVPVLSSGNATDGYTQFTVAFNPTPAGADPATYNYTGTYSYLILPDNGNGTAITAPIWSYINGVLRKGDPMDQNSNAIVDQNPLTTPVTSLTPGDVYAAPQPQPVVPVKFGPNPLSILQPPFNQNSLPLIVPGPQVVSTQSLGTSGQTGSGPDNLLVNDTSSTFNETFDRPMQVSSFTPSEVLQIMGPVGPVTGPQSFQSDFTAQTIPAAASTGTSTTPGVLDSTLTIPSYNGTFTVADITVTMSAAFAPDSDLSAVLIAPDGTQVPLFSGVGGTGSNFLNTVFDDAAETSINTGTAPFTGTYQPTGQLSTLDGHAVDMLNSVGQRVAGVWKLQITNVGTGAPGVLDNWSLNITPQITITPVNPVNGAATTFQLGFPMQFLSGTYTVQLSPNILDTFGQPLDTSQSAGLDVLRDQSQGPNTPTATLRYTSGDLPKPIPAPSATAPGSVYSTINVPDDFLVQGDATPSGISGLRVQINLSYPVDPDLSATLYYDMGTPSQVMVPLFSNVGSGTNTANFTNTVFDDQSSTPVAERRRAVLCDVQPADAAVRVRESERPGGLDAGDPECDDGKWRKRRRRYLQQLVAELPEAAADYGPGCVGQRQCHRELPHLHSGSGRCAVGPGLDAGRAGGRQRHHRSILAETGPAGSARWRSTPPTLRAIRFMSPAPAAASGRRRTS